LGHKTTQQRGTAIREYTAPAMLPE